MNRITKYCLFLVLIWVSMPLAVFAAAADSSQVPTLTLTPMQRVVSTITTTYAAPLFATNPFQTIYSSTNLSGAAACPTTAIQTSTIIPSTQYTVTTKYYATHVHYECGTVAGPASCTSTNGHDSNVSTFSGQSLSQPSSTCAITTSSSPSCSDSDVSCDHKTCSVSTGTWHAFYQYVPDSSGSFTGAYMCIQHGWDKTPIN